MAMFGHISEVDLSHLTPRLHNDCWVVADSRKRNSRGLYLPKGGSLVQSGAIYSEADAMKMADNLNEMVYKNDFGVVFEGMKVEVRGPFYAYRLKTARDLGLL